MTVKFDLANSTMIETIFRGIFATLEGDMPKVAPTKMTLDEQAKEKEGKDEKKKIDEERILSLGQEISKVIPGMMFSPAEIQGYFLKWKREPEKAVENAAAWVEKTKIEKITKEKEERERLEKERLAAEKAEKKAKEAEEKEKAEGKAEGVKLVNGVKEKESESDSESV